MRRANWTVNKAKNATFAIIYYAIIFAVLISVLIFIGWKFILLSFIALAISVGSIARQVIDESISLKKKTTYWFDGPKRKFRTYMGANEKAYVETKVGFFWIPLWDIETLEPEIKYNKNTGEMVKYPRQRLVLATWDSPIEAMEFIHKRRGFSSATLQGHFKA